MISEAHTMTSTQLAWKIRRHAVEMTHLSGSSHIGSVLSVADIIAVLYTDILHFRPDDPHWKLRDRVILSKGHACAALYAVLAEKGFFPTDELLTFYRNGSRLSGHASHTVPGVDISTGSLGHGLGIGVGMAIAARQDRKHHRIFVILGDGECNEGSLWESAQAAATYGLSNLTAIVDRNRLQSLDLCDRTQFSGSLTDKWRAFGWNTVELNGHDHDLLRKALSAAPSGKPNVIIANTVKGFQIPFMENNVLWHYRYPHSGWEYDCAVNALHQTKPEGIEDPYTPDGIPCPILPESGLDWKRDYFMFSTHHPTWYTVPEVSG